MIRSLIISPNWLGDCLMAQPLLTLLQQRGERLTVLCPQPMAPLFRLMPEVSEVISTDFKRGGLQWAARRSVAQQLKNNGFQRAYVLPNSWKSGLIPWLANIPERVGYLGEMRIGLLTERLPNPNKQARPAMRAHYAALAGMRSTTIAPVASAALPLPALSLPTALLERTLAEFGFSAGIEPSVAKGWIALCPGAEYGSAKRWPAEHFAALARYILEAMPEVDCLILGTAKDVVMEQAIRSSLAEQLQKRVHGLCGRTTLEQACALLATARAVVSNDSGLMHVAAALRRPQIALFGSSDPRHTPPLSEVAKVEWLQLSCSPCFKRECPLGHLRCLRDLTPEQVWHSLQGLLQKSV